VSYVRTQAHSSWCDKADRTLRLIEPLNPQFPALQSTSDANCTARLQKTRRTRRTPLRLCHLSGPRNAAAAAPHSSIALIVAIIDCEDLPSELLQTRLLGCCSFVIRLTNLRVSAWGGHACALPSSPTAARRSPAAAAATACRSPRRRAQRRCIVVQDVGKLGPLRCVDMCAAWSIGIVIRLHRVFPGRGLRLCRCRR
jgi:hypothetical protein